MGNKVKIEFNEGWWSKIGFQPGVEKVVETVTSTALAEARSTAPVKSGAYRDSIHVETGRTRRRVLKRLVASDPKSRLIEARTSNLGRAARKAKRFL